MAPLLAGRRTGAILTHTTGAFTRSAKPCTYSERTSLGTGTLVMSRGIPNSPIRTNVVALTNTGDFV